VNRSFRAEAGDGTLGVALARLGEPSSAVGDGRVFVERRRAECLDVPVRAGDEIVVHELEAALEGVTVLGEWQDLYAALKPAGLSTEPDRRGGASLVRSLAAILGVSASVLHAATRLDAAVSGIVVVARGSDAARRVAAIQQEGMMFRRYVALSSGPIEPPIGTWDAPIGKREKGRPGLGGNAARPAATRYRVVAEASSTTPATRIALVALEPVTGRSHQLRVHAAAAGAPLLGDAQRGGLRRLVRPDGRVLSLTRVALHAARVEVVSGEYVEWSIRAPHPEDLVSLFRDVGGDPVAFDAAVDMPWLDAMPRS
jgi:23S rRNA pseudouridine1911/1915/1917 synthase